MVFVHVHRRPRSARDDAAQRREAVAFDLRLGFHSFERITPSAMEIALVDMHLESDRWHDILPGAREQRRILGDFRLAVDAQRFVDARYQEMRPTPAMPGCCRTHRPVVAAPVRDQQRLVVEHRDEARPVAARAGIGVALAIARRQHQERRKRMESRQNLSRSCRTFFWRAGLSCPEGARE